MLNRITKSITNMTSIRNFTSCIAIVIFAYTSAIGQTKNDAINAFNQGRILMTSDSKMAIDSFEYCVKICDQIGDSAKDLREKAVAVIPDLYYQIAYKLYATDKKVPEALTASKNCLSVCDKYNNAKTKEKTEKLMIVLYSSLGASFLKSNENDKALKAFDSVLMINPNYYKAIYNKAIAYVKMSNATEFAKTMDLYFEKSKAEGDTSQYVPARKLALEFYKKSGSKANAANKLPEALSLLNSALKYGNDKDVYYYLSDVYNKQKSYNEALVNAQKGLAMDSTGKPDAKAKFYYQLAVAHMGKGENDDACDSFKNAMYGMFLEPSKAQMTNLKCK
jgi:tetratricopeptide (TPR) repeat protein